MLRFREFLQSGHAPTLWSSFLYFGFSCAVWVINGAMAPFIQESFRLTPTQMGMMLSIPIFAGALMRFPLGILAQYIGRKNATLVEMAGIFAAMAYGYLFVHTYHELLALGVLLGVAGASFGVALSLGSGSFPPRNKGLAMGIVGAGNVGTAVAALLAPSLAQQFGWQAVYGFAAVSVAVPAVVMAVYAKEPPDLAPHATFREHIACLFEKDGWAFSLIYAKEPPDLAPHATFREHIACLFEKDGWAFSLIYAVTFGGFIGLTAFLPSYFYDQFGVSKVQAGQLTMLAAFLGAALRVVGGWLSDHWGGVNTLTAVLAITTVSLVLCGLAEQSLPVTMLLFLVCFAALGAGNGALFQLVPLRWPLSTAVAGSMIGEIGALGGGLIPNAMGISRQFSGTYLWGFVAIAACAAAMLVLLRVMQIRWTRTWAEKGGRARSA